MFPQACSYATLADALSRERPADRALLICIDGPGASGKTTLARRLAATSRDMQLVHLDDFYRPAAERFAGPLAQRPSGADFDLDRLRAEVLAPLRAGSAARYRAYDWETDRVSDHSIDVTRPVVIIEGVYSSCLALCGLYDLSVWVECPRDLRLRRGIARDGEVARSRWEQDWMLGEDQYMAREDPRQRAAFVCDGSHAEAANSVVLLEARRKLPGP